MTENIEKQVSIGPSTIRKTTISYLFIHLLLGALFFISLIPTHSMAALKIESVFPNQGLLGQEIQCTIKGSGFNQYTRVSMTLDVGNRKAMVGNIATPGDATDIIIHNNYAFVADGLNGLQVLDISNPKNPAIVGSVDTAGWASSIALIGTKIYLTDNWDWEESKEKIGLRIIDISNPATPVLVGSIDTPGLGLSVYVAGDYAYLSDKNGALRVIHISDPTNPQMVGSVNTTAPASDVAVAGNMAYVTLQEGDFLIQVIDVSIPKLPKIIGSVAPPESVYGDATAIVIVGDKAYVAFGYSNTLQVIDISTPSTPKIIGSAAIPDYAKNVHVAGEYAYVTTEKKGLQIINVSDPANPILTGAVDTPGTAGGVGVAGPYAFVADFDRVQVVDVGNPLISQVVGRVKTPFEALGIAIDGNTAYVACGGNLQVIDVSNPVDPQPIATVNVDGWVESVTVDNGKAFVSDGAGLTIIDTSFPPNPKILGSVKTNSYAHVAVSGDLAFLADEEKGLYIIDISTSSNPQVLSLFQTTGACQKVAAIGNTAYVGDGEIEYEDGKSGFRVVDISDPSNPQIMGSLNIPGHGHCGGLVIQGNRAYMAITEWGLYVIDISVKEDPQILGFLEIQSLAWDLAIDGQTVYVTDKEDGLQVVDVSDPQNMLIIGSVSTPGNPRDVIVIGEMAYVAESTGLVIVPVPIKIPVGVDGLKSQNLMELTLPSPAISGDYSLQVFNYQEKDEKNGAMNFSKIDFNSIDSNKLLIQTKNGEMVPALINVDENLVLQLVYKAVDGTPFNLSNLPDQIPIQWHSANLDILSVNSQGVVMAKNPGIATVTATIPGGGSIVSVHVAGTGQEKDYGNLIIVSGRSQQSDEEEKLSNFCKLMAKEIYEGFFYANFTHEDIYYLSSYGQQQLFGQDIVDEQIGFTDNLGVQNVQTAITGWAKNQDNTGPLYIYLVDHGANQQFLINPSSILSVAQIDASLDQFQETGRAVILINESCHSGTWINDTLQGENRIIISSTNTLKEKLPPLTTAPSFSKYFFDEFLNGKTLAFSFEAASTSIQNAYSYQAPNKYVGNNDLWTNHLLSNAAFAESSVFKSYTGMDGSISSINPGEGLSLETVLNVISEEGIEVYAIITPPVPGETIVEGEFETPVLEQIKVPLTLQGETEEKGYFGGDKIFQGLSSALNNPGIYELTFHMTDIYGESTSTPAVTFQVGDAQPGLKMVSGWNLLSLPVLPEDTSVDVLFAQILDQVISLWKWTENNWAVYLPSVTFNEFVTYVNSKGFSVLSNIEMGEGFWVNSNIAQDLTVMGTEPANPSCSVNSGWNLIGLKSNQSKSITDYISGNESNIISMWKWGNGNWSVYLPGEGDAGAAYANSKGFGLISNINPGEGFWVNCIEATMLQ